MVKWPVFLQIPKLRPYTLGNAVTALETERINAQNIVNESSKEVSTTVSSSLNVPQLKQKVLPPVRFVLEDGRSGTVVAVVGCLLVLRLSPCIMSHCTMFTSKKFNFTCHAAKKNFICMCS